MSKTFRFGAAVVFASTAVAVASSQGPQDQPRLVTVKGCVERAAAAADRAPATTGTTAAPGHDTKYVLTHVTTEAGPTGTSGTQQGSTALSDARTYRLDDADQAKVAEHVGRTVEIAGALESQPEAATGTSGSADAPTADAIAPRLKVNSVRVMAETCPEK